LYHFSNEIHGPYRIRVRYGDWTEGVSKVSAPEELFPADEPESMLKTFLLDDGMNGEVEYWFYPFYTGHNQAPNKLTEFGGCRYYNTSSVSWYHKPVRQYTTDGYSLKDPQVRYDDDGKEQWYITVPTDLLRNDTSSR